MEVLISVFRIQNPQEEIVNLDAKLCLTGPYKNTVNLPQTKFNMRANSKQREPELHKFWTKERVYERLSRDNPGDVYTLHDGPPYANGDLHCGHALNKVCFALAWWMIHSKEKQSRTVNKKEMSAEIQISSFAGAKGHHK